MQQKTFCILGTMVHAVKAMSAVCGWNDDYDHVGEGGLGLGLGGYIPKCLISIDQERVSVQNVLICTYIVFPSFLIYVCHYYLWLRQNSPSSFGIIHSAVSWIRTKIVSCNYINFEHQIWITWSLGPHGSLCPIWWNLVQAFLRYCTLKSGTDGPTAPSQKAPLAMA